MKEINLTTKISVYPLEECSEIEKKLISDAKKATQSAYAPYSEFRVGVAILLENGQTVIGNNQENAAYPSGLCAERTAMFFANANYPDQKIEAIAIAAFHKGEFTNEVTAPCGACRQVLLEVENRFKKPFKILMYCQKGVYTVNSIRDLLPMSFGEEMLR